MFKELRVATALVLSYSSLFINIRYGYGADEPADLAYVQDGHIGLCAGLLGR